MIHILEHIIGICGDNKIHLDLLDILLFNNNEFSYMINYIKIFFKK